MNSAHVSRLLQQTQHHDSDERYMATSDLIAALSAVDGLIDAGLQLPIRNAVLKQLTDKSIDVQAVAVKCLSMLVRKFHSPQVVDVVVRLGALAAAADQAEESRDIYVIGLKTMVGAVRAEDGAAIAPRLVETLLDGVRAEDARLCAVCLDLLRDLVARFGAEAAPQHAALVQEAFPLLRHGDDAVRRNASAVLGALARDLANAPFHELVGRVADVEGCEGAAVYTYIQTVSIMSRNAGPRVGKHLGRILPRLQSFCHITSGESEEALLENERHVALWENCLQAFETVIERCPGEVGAHVEELVRTALTFLSFDPNYSYDDDDDEDGGGGIGQGGGDDGWGDDGDAEDGGGGGGGWGDEDDEDDEGMGGFEAEAQQDDDDTSWKARRAAAGVLHAVARGRAAVVAAHYDRLLGALVGRFKERDDNVRGEVLLAARVLVARAPRLPPAAMDSLRARLPALAAAVASGLRAGARPSTRGAVASVARALAAALPGGLADVLGSVVPHALDAAASRDSTLQAEAVTLLHELLRTHPPESWQEWAGAAADAAVAAVGQAYPRTKTAGVVLCGLLAASVGGGGVGGGAAGGRMYAAVRDTAAAKETDPEVKGAAIGIMAGLLAAHGDQAPAEVASFVDLCVRRLRSDPTRLAALRGLARVGGSPLPLQLEPALRPVLEWHEKFLRKQSKALRHESALTAGVLVARCGAALSLDEKRLVLAGALPLLSDSDLLLSQRAADLMRAVLACDAAAAPCFAADVLGGVLEFLRSPLLQGRALAALVALLEEAARAGAASGCAELSYGALVDRLVEVAVRAETGSAAAAVDVEMTPASGGDGAGDAPAAAAGRQPGAAVPVAAVVAALFPLAPDGAARRATVARFAGAVTGGAGDRPLALHVLGELGRANVAEVRERDEEVSAAVERVLLSGGDEGEGVQAAAAHALGRITLGDVSTWLPRLLALVAAHEAAQYHLFGALREVLSEPAAVRPLVGAVAPALFRGTESAEEGVRGVVAECLGRLVLADPDAVLPQMAERLASPSPHARAAVVTAFRHALPPPAAAAAAEAEAAAAPDACAAASAARAALTRHAPAFFLLEDADLHVRRQALLTVTATVNQGAGLVADGVVRERVAPVLYRTMRLTMVRVVDFGPFKQKVDDALPLRKAAYQCLATLLEAAPERLELGEAVAAAREGLADHDDVQVLAYEVLASVAASHGAAMLEHLDELPPFVMKGIKDQLKAAKGAGVEAQRAKDVLRTAVRSLYAMHSVPGSDTCPAFANFYLRVLKTALLAQMLREMLASQAPEGAADGSQQ